MPIHEAYEYDLGEHKYYTTFYLDPMDQVGQIMIKMEDTNGNTLDAINIFISQEPSDPFMINHDKFLTFLGSKEEKKYKIIILYSF